MTDKEKINAIRAEVQNYIDAAHKAHTNITEGNFAHLLSFIDSLQEEPASEELEEAAEEYSRHLVTGEIDGKVLEQMGFKAGAKWQKEQDKETIELAEDHAMFAGMNKMEEQIMNKAKSGIGDKDNYIKFEDDTWLDLDPTMKLKPAFDVKEGEKVKVLIIKEV